jgi:hypothetical protein
MHGTANNAGHVLAEVMSNVCLGLVTVSGDPNDIERFCRLFFFEDDDASKWPDFGRSCVNQTWDAFKREKLDKATASFEVEFAWSAAECLIEIEPEESQGKRRTLAEACVEHHVNVEIETDEPGFCFEESISCSSEGELTYDIMDMACYQCECGNIQPIPSRHVLEEVACFECNVIGQWTEDD